MILIEWDHRHLFTHTNPSTIYSDYKSPLIGLIFILPIFFGLNRLVAVIIEVSVHCMKFIIVDTGLSLCKDTLSQLTVGYFSRITLYQRLVTSTFFVYLCTQMLILFGFLLYYSALR